MGRDHVPRQKIKAKGMIPVSLPTDGLYPEGDCRLERHTKRHLRHKETPDMRKRGGFSNRIAEIANYRRAYAYASKGKASRRPIIRFEANLEKNLAALMQSFRDETFRTSPYHFMTVRYPKERLIGMLPFPDHVQHWAILLEIEDYFSKSFSAYTYGGIKKRGPHAYLRAIRSAIKRQPDKTRDYLLCDIHHFYPTVNHSILKDMLRTRIKDKHLLARLDEIIDSVPGEVGMYPGTKLAQFFSLAYLYRFDHDLKRCFGIKDNPVLVAHYTRRYIEERIATAKTKADYEDLSRGVQYLGDKFRGYLNRLDFAFRLADDVLVLHEDTVFLHFVVEWIGLYYARELKLELNSRWKVGHVADGVDTGGYVHYPDHVRVRKRTKVALCRQVARMRKRGMTEEEIRRAASSRAGFVQHANCINLFNKLGMETTRKRLGQVIRSKKSPWPDLSADKKLKFEDILYDTRLPEEQRGSEEDKVIELLDYKIEDSKIETNADGTPKKCLAIRYRWHGEEHYSFTGSSVLIDQAEKDFSHEDLPVDTVVQVLENKFKKKFFRFT